MPGPGGQVEWGATANGNIPFCGDENVLGLDNCDGCTILVNIFKPTELYLHFKKVDFMVCGLYQLKKKNKEKPPAVAAATQRALAPCGKLG